MTRRITVGLATGLVLATALVWAAPARAHQPVDLGPGDATPATGPLLVDGTVSFAVNASLTKRDQARGFRVGFNKGQSVQIQLLIKDVSPANTLPNAALPQVTVTDPTGRRTVLVINERTPFYEPYSGTSYLYLARFKQTAVTGTYQVSVNSRSAQPVMAVIGVGYREVPGKVMD
ncbi:MAG: hypothetical protein ACKOE2_04140 [Actinomycetales bacterium]|jgi:hypothetical protein